METNFLFCTDLHLRSTVPSCRRESVKEYIDYQIMKLEEMFQYCREHQIHDIICGGDFFDRWKSEDSNYLLFSLIELFHDYDDIDMYTICGNHDMPYHNTECIRKSLFGIMGMACENFVPMFEPFEWENINFTFFDYGKEITNAPSVDENDKKFQVAIVHTNIFKDSVPYYMDGVTAEEFIDKYGYDLTLAGHLHQNYTYEKNGKILVNGGCLTRQNIAQKKFRPCFWDITISDNDNKFSVKIEPVNFTTNTNEIVDDSLKKNDIGTFVEIAEGLKTSETFDFKQDVMNELERQKCNAQTKDIIEECFD